MTAFVAMVTMDANRQEAGRIDWCCCFTCKSHLEEQQVRTRSGPQFGGLAWRVRCQERVCLQFLFERRSR